MNGFKYFLEYSIFHERTRHSGIYNKITDGISPY